jgi:tetratricopeptide (TPR) repeat protein
MTRERIQSALLLLLPPLLFLGLYLRALDYDFVWTDRGEIVYGILIQPPGHLLEAFWQPMHPDLDTLSPGAAQPYYRPLQAVIASWIDAEFGKQPRAFRALSLILGAATALLFTLFARQLSGDLRSASLAGAIFAAHPAGIEIYVWIAGLSAALATGFILLSLLGAQLALRARAPTVRGALVLLSVTGLILGLLSKENAVITPALLLACVVSAAVAERRRTRAAGAALPRRFRSAAFALLLLQGLLTAAFVFWWRPRVLGGVLSGSPPIEGSYAAQVLTGLASWPDRLSWLLLPLHSTTSDVVRIASSPLEPMAWLGVALAVGSLALWVRLLRRGHAVAALGLAWIWIAFLPTSGVLPLTHLRAERYLSLSVFGVGLIWPVAGTHLLRGQLPKAPRWLAPALAALLVLGLAQRSWVRTPDWRSDIALFERDLERDPRFREGYYTLASALVREGRLEEARSQLEELRAVGARFAGLWSFLRVEDAFNLYCRVNLNLGRGPDTLPLFGDELRADSNDLPLLPHVYLCGARTLEEVGRVEEALAIFLRLRDLNPAAPDPTATVGVARCHARMGRYSEAREWLGRVPPAALDESHLFGEVMDVRARIRRGDPDTPGLPAP